MENVHVPNVSRRQITDVVLMVRPSEICFNPQTAGDNFFQRETPDVSQQSAQANANAEFEHFVEQLRVAGIQVIVADVSNDPEAPDAVFPNNWVSFHDDGKVILYPMMAVNRRRERRPEIIEQVRMAGFEVDSLVDYSAWEQEGLFLEGTGSLVLDRVNRLAFASLSPRTNEQAVRRWCEVMDYAPITFRARQLVAGQARPIYHTNVMMGIGDTWIVICLESIENSEERAQVRDALASTGRILIEIDERQMHRFAGNVMQLSSADGIPITVISQTALDALTPAQRHGLARGSRLLSAEIPAIETCGGGSVRCMLAEIFLRRQKVKSRSGKP